MRLGRALGGTHLYDCTVCDASPAYYQILGHDGTPGGLWDANLVTGEPLTRCPLRTILLAPAAARAEMRRYVDTYLPAYEEGFLLVAGGIADQPARYVELVQLSRAFQRVINAKHKALRGGQGDDDGEE